MQRECPVAPSTQEVAAVMASARKSLNEFVHEVKTEKRMAGEDFVLFANSLVQFFNEGEQLFARFDEVFQFMAAENLELQARIDRLQKTKGES